MKKPIRMTALVALLALAGFAGAAETRLDFGRHEYQSKCASCHGTSATGDGVLMPYLVRPPADLTALARRNGGTFPASRVGDAIDGRGPAAVRGLREMPLWGIEYRIEAGEYYGEAPRHAEAHARTRIAALIEYLHRIQE